MCYDISFKTEIEQLSDYFPDLVHDDQITIDFDKTVHIIGHDYGHHPILYTDTRGDNRTHLKMMEWGVIPYYIKDEEKFKRQRASMLNIRSERILDDEKSYWYKIRSKRCLIPMNAIYEHRKIKGWKKKAPYYIKLKNQRTFFVPGLFSVTELPDKETGEMMKRWSFALITCPANDVMKMIHNDGDNRWRMPLFLPLDWSKKWLDANLAEDEYRAILKYEMPSEEVEHYTVWSVRTKDTRPDGKAKDEPFVWENLPELCLEEE